MDGLNYPTQIDLFTSCVVTILGGALAAVIGGVASDRERNKRRALASIVVLLLIWIVAMLVWYNGLGYLMYWSAISQEKESGCAAAVVNYERAIRLNPKFGDARTHLIKCKISQGRTTELLDILEPMAITEADNVAYWRDMARIYLQLNDRDKMLNAITRSDDLEPKNMSWLIDLAQELLSESKLAQKSRSDPQLAYAETLLNIVLAHDASDSFAVYWRAWVQYERGESDEALRSFDRCIELFTKGDELPRCYAGRGFVLARLRRPVESREALRKSLSLKPDQEDVQVALGEKP